MAWRVPPVWKDLQTDQISAPENSKVWANQKRLLAATQATLDAIFKDVSDGLLETVGVRCSLIINERCSVALELPEGTDAENIAHAIDAENIEAWLDENKQANIGISPWFSAKDVDQAVLSAVKVVHVLIGIHASDAAQPKTFKEKLLSSIAEIMQIQSDKDQKKN